MRQSKLRGTILVVDDEPYVRESLAAILRRKGYEARTADGSGLEAPVLDGLDAVITDLRMPGEDGLQVLRRFHERDPLLPVIILTAHASVPSAVECMKAGAYEYLQKPANPEQLLLVLERALEHNSMRRELEYLRSRPAAGAPVRPLIGESAGWKRVLEMVELAAPSDTTVLLLGESGTGKSQIAHLLHQKSRRTWGPFVQVNCAAIPEGLFESEFFGHRRGSFTGAVANREGRLRIAHRGTLFMDEISCLSESVQAKVLRVLEDGYFERVGDSQPTSVDVRLIAASNIDLGREVREGRFRADLFYRINVMTIAIPPLRERRKDISLLADFFLKQLRSRLGKTVDSIDSETLAIFDAYDWPGNVRELRNVIERGVLLEKTSRLLPGSLPFNLLEAKPHDSSLHQDLNLRTSLAAQERCTLQEALKRSRGVRREAARLLGIDERNLSYYLRKHGLAKQGKKQ